MAAVKYDLTIEKGAKFLQTFLYQTDAYVGIPLTNYEGRMQIRERQSYDVVLIDLTSNPANGIILEQGAEDGRVDIEISAVDTDTLTFTRGVYDLELYNPADPSDVIRLVEGVVHVVPNVTR